MNDLTLAGSDRLKMEEDHLNLIEIEEATLFWFLMPAHHLIYENMFHGNNNKLKIHPKGLAT